MTLGFRVLHLYFPRSGVIMAMGLNSATGNDHIGTLALLAYETLACDHIISATCRI